MGIVVPIFMRVFEKFVDPIIVGVSVSLLVLWLKNKLNL